MATQNTYIHVWDVCPVLEKLVAHELAPMNDPSGATGRIHACSSDATREDALSKLDTAAARAHLRELRKVAEADVSHCCLVRQDADILVVRLLPARGSRVVARVREREQARQGFGAFERCPVRTAELDEAERSINRPR